MANIAQGLSIDTNGNLANSNPPAPTTAGLLIGALNKKMGVQAKSPATNMTAQPNTLTASQTAPIKPPTSTPQTTSNTSVPTTVPTTASSATPAPATPNTFTTPSGAQVDTNGNMTSGPTNTNTGLYPGLIASVAQTANNNAGIGQQAANIGADYGKQIKDAQTAMVSQEGTVGGQGILPVALGRQGLIANNLGNYIQGLSQAENAQLVGTGQQLTANSQQASGLNAAAGLAKPEGNFPFVFNPATGSYSVSGGNLQGAISTGVQQAVGNPALYSSLHDAIQSTYGAASAGMFQQAYIQAGGNPQTAAASGTAAAQNTQTAGTAQTGAANTAYQQYYKQAIDTNTALNNVQSLGSLALQTQQGGSINPFTVTAANQTLASLRSQLSDPAQAQFDQTMATFQGALSQLLAGSSDVTPTQLSTWSTQIANRSMPVQVLQGIYSQGIKEGNLKLNNSLSAASAAYQQVQGANQNTNTNGTTNATTANPWH